MAVVPSLYRPELQKMRPIYQLALLLFSVVNLCYLRAGAQNVANKTLSVNIGVVLDFDSIIGKVSNTCISMALSDFYAIHNNYTSRLVIHSRDSNTNAVATASAALDLMKNVEVLAIIGPETSGETTFVADMGNNSQVPIVSFTASSPSLSSSRTPYFVRTGQNDSAQVNAIAAIVQTFGWREVVPIYEDSEYGKGVIPYLIDALQELEAKVPFRSVIPTSAIDDQIREELYKLMTMQTRVFVVHMSYSLGARLFLLAKEVGMMSDEYAWIITDGISDLLESLDSTVIDAMQGVLGVKIYLPKSKPREAFTIRWKQIFRRENPDLEKAELSSFGLWAYDTVWALAMAVEQISGSITASFRFKKNLAGNSTDLEALGVSPVGPNLLKAILSMRFNGLSGEFRLVDGQLQSSTFQIVNVVGKGGRGIGFWTPAAGISRNLNPNNMSKSYSASKNNLKAIIWPGESTVVPRGWVVLPLSGKKLRIGVPVKTGFSEFVRVKQNPVSNGTTVEGFCIDVFDSVMQTLPYGVPYEYVPYQNATGQAAGTYDDLSYQVHLQNFDAAIGDITIIANRSQYVDFTQPFTVSGVSMIVPVKNDRSSNAWVFLEPLTDELWLTSGVFFMFTGFVVWILEHRINPEFRGHPSEQLGTIFFFAFSTMVFAHREKIESNLSRFVVIIWVFVVLILTQSYTASLTSMLTVQQLKPTVADIDSLLKNGAYVGYQEGSFVVGLLKSLKFDENKLRAYGTPEEYAEALSKGSQNGGVAAIFDEIPYINLFLARYCNNFTMVGPTYKTGGFGFVFPKGSPLVSDISRAVLNITEGDKMTSIEKTWVVSQSTCPDPAASINSSSLSLQSFWGLFLITGSTSLTALFIFTACFLYNHIHVLRNSSSPVVERISTMAKRFDEKDMSAHAFRNNEPKEVSMVTIRGPVFPTDDTSVTASPSSNSIGLEIEIDEDWTPDEGTSSAEFLTPHPNVPAPM